MRPMSILLTLLVTLERLSDFPEDLDVRYISVSLPCSRPSNSCSVIVSSASLSCRSLLASVGEVEPRRSHLLQVDSSSYLHQKYLFKSTPHHDHSSKSPRNDAQHTSVPDQKDIPIASPQTHSQAISTHLQST